VVVSGRAFCAATGTPRSYVKTAESGDIRRHAFCGKCGTPIYACAAGDRATPFALVLSAGAQRFHRNGESGGSALDWVDTALRCASDRERIWRTFKCSRGGPRNMRARAGERKGGAQTRLMAVCVICCPLR
jgi:hypothetical protein